MTIRVKQQQPTKVFAKAGLDIVTSAMCYYQQWFGLDVHFLALVFNFNKIFSIKHLFPAGRSMNSLPSQILNVSCHFVGHDSPLKFITKNLTPQTDKTKNILVLTPIFGTIIFVVLYVVATLLYPGGSQVDKNSIGFSWTNNYWCNLLNENAINGQPNPAKPVAMTGMFVLCLTLAFFWFLFPRHINLDRKLKLAIQISGTLAMTIAFFLFTNINHDLVTNLASIFGLIATVGTFVGLYKTKWFGLFAFGLLNILLVGLNNYVYYTKGLIVYLPVIQKISFATFLIWVCCIDVKLYRGERKTAGNNRFAAMLARRNNNEH